MRSIITALGRLTHLSLRQVKCPYCAGAGIAAEVPESLTPAPICGPCDGDGWVLKSVSRASPRPVTPAVPENANA